MDICGIKFAPFNIPLHRRLETFSIAFGSFLIISMPIASIAISLYILLCTKYWWFIVAYAIYIATDKAPENGGRLSTWFRSWGLFYHAKNYFPLNIKTVPEFKLDRGVNYLCAWFPHGFLPVGVPVGLTYGFGEKFRNHIMQTVTINCNFYIPFSREIILALGACKATPKSLSYMLSSPGKGKFVMLPVGGASEALNFKRGEYRIPLKNRKGFIKLALKNGSPVVPVFSFGENDLWDQVIFPDGSMVRRIQLWIKSKTNFTPLLFNGRGFFQYTFGLLPRRSPINVIVGKPLDFGKRINPTQAEIDNAHQIFIKALVAIFEEYKHQYVPNPEQCLLIIE